jgi:hypothetical protein
MLMMGLVSTTRQQAMMGTLSSATVQMVDWVTAPGFVRVGLQVDG